MSDDQADDLISVMAKQHTESGAYSVEFEDLTFQAASQSDYDEIKVGDKFRVIQSAAFHQIRGIKRTTDGSHFAPMHFLNGAPFFLAFLVVPIAIMWFWFAVVGLHVPLIRGFANGFDRDTQNLAALMLSFSLVAAFWLA